MRRVVFGFAVPLAVVLLSVPACGGDAATDVGETPVSPVGAADAAGSADASSSEADAAHRRDGSFVEDELADATYPADVHFAWDSGTTDAALTTDAACAEATATATLRPLDLFVVLDRSGSMSETSPSDTSAVWGTNDCTVSAGGAANASKWCLAVNALGGFFQLPNQGDRRAALQFFPTNLELGSGVTPDVNGAECTGSAVGTPAVALVALPASATQLVTALDNATPNGSYTTTEGAIRGMNAFTASAANRSASRTLAQVLITDGAPTACTLRDNASLAALLTAQRTQQGVSTFVVGMNGANYTNLEALAVGGGAAAHSALCASGTPSCHYYDVGSGSASAFSQALRDIQLAAVGCTYNLPTPAQGVLDPERVRVSYQSGSSNVDLTRVTNAAACGATSSGWHYDNNTSPTSVKLCPTTCTTVRADAAAQVRVLFGCLRG